MTVSSNMSVFAKQAKVHFIINSHLFLECYTVYKKINDKKYFVRQSANKSVGFN